tara:strand:- start:289 stop:1059 length:771 start_codon:yes stop_codon:yes gene_type:complete
LNFTSNFNKKGYAIAENVFTAEFISELVLGYDLIVKQLEESGENINARWGSELTQNIEKNDSVVIHTHNVQSYSAIMLTMVQNRRLLDLAESLIGPDIILHHTKLFLKPPINGAAFPLHQDWSYFPTEKNSMIAAMVHLSDSTAEMGCIRVVPGSHKLGKLKKSDGHIHNPEIHDKYHLDEADPIIAKLGDITFFHCCSIHGSMPNVSDKPRKSILVQLYSGNDKIIDGNQHINVQLVLRGHNHRATRYNVETNAS